MRCSSSARDADKIFTAIVAIAKLIKLIKLTKDRMLSEKLSGS